MHQITNIYLYPPKDNATKLETTLHRTHGSSNNKQNMSTFSLGILFEEQGVQGEVYLFGVLRRFQHCTGHITTDSWKDRGNQYIQFVRVLYCKLPTNGKQLYQLSHLRPCREPNPGLRGGR